MYGDVVVPPVAGQEKGQAAVWGQEHEAGAGAALPWKKNCHLSAPEVNCCTGSGTSSQEALEPLMFLEKTDPDPDPAVAAWKGGSCPAHINGACP